MSQPLTIVIPYFKLRYLDAALASLAAQSRSDLKVFIGDDASPEDPREVIQKYRHALAITYRRFDQNLGRTSLVQHWNRCVRQTESEWVWLFSDDDVASPGCLESFLETLEKTGGSFDVYRFNTRTVDGNDGFLHAAPKHPAQESGADFAIAKLKYERCSFAVEYIFRRSAFDAAGGFVDFPLAWFSDDASWVAFSRRTGINTMEKGEVSWRQSGLNVSTLKPEYAGRKLDAFRLYILWLKKEVPEANFQKRLKAQITPYFLRSIDLWVGKPGLKDSLKCWLFLVRFTGRLNFFLLRSLLGLTGIRSYLGLRKGSPAISQA